MTEDVKEPRRSARLRKEELLEKEADYTDATDDNGEVVIPDWSIMVKAALRETLTFCFALGMLAAFVFSYFEPLRKYNIQLTPGWQLCFDTVCTATAVSYMIGLFYSYYIAK